MISDPEPPRPEPDFRVYVHQHGGDSIDVTHAVTDVYDLTIRSLDFGSGFLSTEEVENLRQLGKAIGAEPFRYQHDLCRCGHTSGHHFGPEGNVTCMGIGGTGCSCTAFTDKDDAR